jgi:four helix bundle protein
MTQFSNNKYNLEERTAKFGERVIDFCRTLEQNTISKPLIGQLIRSATSIGANYMEANGASSKTDFRNKIFICKKEAQETKHWLRMLSVAEPDKKDQLRVLWQEAQELTMIFQKITTTLSVKSLKNET